MDLEQCFQGIWNKVFNGSGKAFKESGKGFSWTGFYLDFWNVPVFRGSGFVSLRELLQMS